MPPEPITHACGHTVTEMILLRGWQGMSADEQRGVLAARRCRYCQTRRNPPQTRGIKHNSAQRRMDAIAAGEF